MLDGLAQGLLLGLLQGGRIGLVEAGRVFAVGAEHLREEARRHLAVLRAGGVGGLGDRPQHHPPGESGIVRRIVRGKARCGPRAQAMDGGADHEVGQRHALSGPDDRGNDAHATPLALPPPPHPAAGWYPAKTT